MGDRHSRRLRYDTYGPRDRRERRHYDERRDRDRHYYSDSDYDSDSDGSWDYRPRDSRRRPPRRRRSRSREHRPRDADPRFDALTRTVDDLTFSLQKHRPLGDSRRIQHGHGDGSISESQLCYCTPLTGYQPFCHQHHMFAPMQHQPLVDHQPFTPHQPTVPPPMAPPPMQPPSFSADPPATQFAQPGLQGQRMYPPPPMHGPQVIHDPRGSRPSTYFDVPSDLYHDKSFAHKAWMYKNLDPHSFQIRLLQIQELQADEGEKSHVTCCLVTKSLIERPKYHALSYCWGDPKEQHSSYVRICMDLAPRLKSKKEKKGKKKVRLEDLGGDLYPYETGLDVFGASTRPWDDVPMAPLNGPLNIPESDDSLRTTKLSVSRNLEQALQELRRRRITHVWVDFLCINQKDQEEKARQVMLMDRIFSQAITVFSWLGASTAHTDLVVSMLHDCARGSTSTQVAGLSEFVRKILRRLLLDLYGNPYWKRVWIIQELAKPEKILFLWGKYELQWDLIVGASKSDAFHDLVPEPEQVVFSALCEFRSREQRSNIVSYRKSLLDALFQSRRSLASDPRDKIYALLGMSSDGSHIVPYLNYLHPEREIYLSAAQGIIVRQRKVAAILLARAIGPFTPLLPSWTPDWSALNDCGADDSAKTKENEASGKSASGPTDVSDFGAPTLPEWILTAVAEMEIERHNSYDITAEGSMLTLPCKKGDSVISLFNNSTTPASSPNLPSIVTSFTGNEGSGMEWIVSLFEALTWKADTPSAQTTSQGREGSRVQYSSTTSSPQLFTFAALCLGEIKMALAQPVVTRFMEANQAIRMGGRSIRETLEEYHASVLSSATEPPSFKNEVSDEIVKGIQRLEDNEMRLAITRRGHIKTVFDEAQIGDEICYLPDCSLPVLLRPVEDHYRFVGEVWEKPGSRSLDGEDWKGADVTLVTLM